jgi:endo-1,4-beta-xylanase
VNTVILRNRLRRDGCNPQTDEVYDALQAIRLVRAHASELNFDPNKIGIMVFSAGAELSAPIAVLFKRLGQKEQRSERSAGRHFVACGPRRDYLSGTVAFRAESDRADHSREHSPAFIACAESDDAGHAMWADEYFAAMLPRRISNIEMHIYGTASIRAIRCAMGAG